MLIALNALAHIASVNHEGKVIIVAIDALGKVYYTVRQDGFEETYINTPANQRTGWENWQTLMFPDEPDDDSVVSMEKSEHTYQSEDSQYIMRSIYRSGDMTDVAPLTVMSAFGHVYVFRQSIQKTLLIDRYIFDGLTNKLNRKIEVRFKRSRQKNQPSKNMVKGSQGLVNVDGLDFVDSSGNYFHEPTTELSLINQLSNGWFSVVSNHTIENDVFRWHIFFYNNQSKKIEAITLRASDDGLFSLTDYTVLDVVNEATTAHKIPGVIRHSFAIDKGMIVNGPSATKYDLQQEQESQDGAMQLLRTDTRIMLSIPTDQGVAALSFAIAGDGTLSLVTEKYDRKILRSKQKEVLLPLNVLDEVKGIGDKTRPPEGVIVKMSASTATDGVEDFLKVSTSGRGGELSSGDLVKVTTSIDYNGMYKSIKVDNNTFDVELASKVKDLGNWEKIDPEQAGLFFDGMISGYEKTSDGKLRITCENHGMETGDAVQVVGADNFDNIYPIRRIDDWNFIVETKWIAGESINIKLASRRRRGLVLDGVKDYITLPEFTLSPTQGLTIEAWVWYDAFQPWGRIFDFGNGAGADNILLANDGANLNLTIVKKGRGSALQADGVLETGKWIHLAATIDEKGNAALFKDGQKIRTGKVLIPDAVKRSANFIGKSNWPNDALFKGRLSDMRIWTTTRNDKQIRDAMYLQLSGREVNLWAYWRLGGVSDRKILDFSVNGRDGVIVGDPYVSAATLNRKLSNGEDAVKYSNEELIAVSARSTYQESFEFRVVSDKPVDLKYLDNVDTKGNKIFAFSYWGKSSRGSETKIIIDAVSQDNFVDLGNGWYRANCIVTIPDNVTLMRCFELVNARGVWKSIEIRKHALALISNSITEVIYTDTLSLQILGGDQSKLNQIEKNIIHAETAENSLINEKNVLERKISDYDNQKIVRDKITSLEKETEVLKNSVDAAKAEYEKQKNDISNYWFYIKGVDNLYARILSRSGKELQINNDEKEPIRNFELFRMIKEEEDVYSFRFEPVPNMVGKYYIVPKISELEAWKLSAFAFILYFHPSYEAWSPVELADLSGGQKRLSIIFGGMKCFMTVTNINCPNKRYGEDVIHTLIITPADYEGSNEAWRQRFDLVTTDKQCNVNIENAKKAFDSLNETYKSKTSELKDLKDSLTATKKDRDDWDARLKIVITTLGSVQLDLAKLTTDCLKILSIKANKPQSMMPLATDYRGLRTLGGVLGFIQSIGPITSLETCEGNVQLTYFDDLGRMRITNYDATADTANSSFEQWIPDNQRPCLNLQNSGSMIVLDAAIPTFGDYTLEAWFSWPLPKNPVNSLFHSESASYILVAENKRLGLFLNNDPLGIHFYECGFDMEKLENGWHHICSVSSKKDTTFFIDGLKVGSVKDYARLKIDSALIKNKDDSIAKSQKGHLDEADITIHDGLKYLGGYRNDWGGQQFGKISELRIWDVALSDDEVMVNSKTLLSGNEPGLLAYFPLTEGTGERVRNYTGLSTGGATLAGSWSLCTARFGNPGNQVACFDGIDDYIQVPEQTIDFSKGLTIELWAYYDNFNSWSRLVDFANDGLSYAIILANDGVSSTLNLSIFTNAKGNIGGAVQAKDALETGVWMHLAAIIDPSGTGSLYKNGELLASGKIPLPPSVSRKNNYFGKSNFTGDGFFKGRMSQVRIWNSARSVQDIKQSMNRTLSGNENNLICNYPLDRIVLHEGNLKVGGSNGVYGIPFGIRIAYSTAVPVTGAVLHAVEYNTIMKNPKTGVKTAMMRRAYAYPVNDGFNLISDKRIENLELKWIGNAQFAPTLMGYIEGAPPVPSENLTESDDYNGASSVQLTMSEDMEFNWSRSDESAYGSHLDIFAGAGGKASTIFGLVVQEGFEHEFKLGAKLNADFSFSSAYKTNIACHSTLSLADRLDLRGSVEKSPRFQHLGNRFIPKNVGYALVVSSLADVFVTRLSRSGRMIGYQVEPVEGMPPDVNTITFLMNPAYTMNGSLDGMTGSSATSDRFHRHVPEMRAQYGSLYPASYYRLKEAYDLKQQIEAEDKRREAFFVNYVVSSDRFDYSTGDNFTPTEMSLNREETKPEIFTSETEEQKKARSAKQGAKKSEEMERASSQAEKETTGKAEEKKKLIEQKISDTDRQAHATDTFAGWQKKMEDIQIRSGKRNIVNTYVWDADGGLRAETQSYASTVQHSIGGTKVGNFGVGGLGEFQGGFVSLALTAQATINLTQSISKSEIRSKGLQLNVDMSGLEFRGITDYNDNPVIPGEKVDRYRFMSFFLEGSTRNFKEFFEYVVDPEWLRSNDEEARALRQTQAGKPNKTWRVLHRVTYVERPALMGFGRDARSLKAPAEISEHKDLVNRISQLEIGNKDLSMKVDKILEAIKSKTLS